MIPAVNSNSGLLLDLLNATPVIHHAVHNKNVFYGNPVGDFNSFSLIVIKTVHGYYFAKS